ncbi:MAG: hypothetical protein RR311_14375 [Comamonas sp.]|uniref:hypothetical protein n=1 Tax=Acidovorax sp. CCYZU-2555 TaxID=2835042 RepID=UPI001BD1ABC4|nr:hypothetical protein [Acidovorax sp. CCYZU-2555]MBS7777891.1 hypothetical protein [Acidovorax sp. CCYZU-2555]
MKICMRWCAALALAAGLAGCAGGSPVNEGASSGSGITVFGDIDVGVSRVR